MQNHPKWQGPCLLCKRNHHFKFHNKIPPSSNEKRGSTAPPDGELRSGVALLPELTLIYQAPQSKVGPGRQRVSNMAMGERGTVTLQEPLQNRREVKLPSWSNR